MNRRRFLTMLGMVSATPLLAQAAPTRFLTRYYAGEMNVAGNTTLLSLQLTTSGRSRIVTGRLWLNGDVEDVHEITGRFQRDRKRLAFQVGLVNSREIRFEGKGSQGGAFLSGRVRTYVDGAPVAGGTFSLSEVSTPDNQS